MPRWLLYTCAILATLGWAWLPGGRAEKVLGEEDDEFDFDGLPGAQHEFKVEVAAGREQCYFQMVKAGGRIHVSFEALSGGGLGEDGLVTVSLKNSYNSQYPLDLAVNKPDGVLMHSAETNDTL